MQHYAGSSSSASPGVPSRARPSHIGAAVPVAMGVADSVHTSIGSHERRGSRQQAAVRGATAEYGAGVEFGN
jgi:hypothetical protein